MMRGEVEEDAMSENYDQRRSRCMLDQSSNTQNPVWWLSFDLTKPLAR